MRTPPPTRASLTSKNDDWLIGGILCKIFWTIDLGQGLKYTICNLTVHIKYITRCMVSITLWTIPNTNFSWRGDSKIMGQIWDFFNIFNFSLEVSYSISMFLKFYENAFRFWKLSKMENPEFVYDKKNQKLYKVFWIF